MKNFIYILLGMFFCTSCNFLDTDTYDYLEEEDIYRDPTGCLAGLAGVYDVLASQGCYGQHLWGDLDAGTDILVYNRPQGKDYIQVSNYNYNNTDNSLKTTWAALYEGINRANDFLGKISNRTDEECGGASAKAMYMAEAKVLRALFYMNLVAFWGEVPLRLEPTYDLKTQLKKKATQEELYAQIIKDLEEAAPYCLSAKEHATPGRVSQTAVYALLARVYMWQSGYPVKANTWDKALEYARLVRNSGLHRLYPQSMGGYQEFFKKMCSNQYDLDAYESMWEVEFYGNGQTQSNEAGRLGLYIGVQQQTASNNHPYAYAFYDATKYLFRLYEENDERRWWNIADYKYKTEDGEVYEVPRTDSEKSSEDGNAAKWRAKYIPERPLSRNNSSINFPIIRYADVLLMIAECANEVNQGPTNEAITALNLVRRRAGASEISLADYPDYIAFKQLVFEERTRELCFEVPRRMELRRHGADFFESQINILKDQSLNSKNKKIGYDLDHVKAVPAINFAPKHIYFPIPQSELNVNTDCVQRDDW